ncbi:MAG: DUF2791 family P-loop domain-containing protein [Fimbriimonadaceae bacterium]|nr:DUF2791 family P-loop domain-containing protein [Fimbriimonadaceae bacterium]
METIEARRVIEALRTGVPSRAAVKSLGAGSAALERAFVRALEAKSETTGAEPILFQGPFGMGKSHLLLHWRSLAEERGFATSQVVIGPETPLGNPNAVQRAVAESARAPGTTGKAVKELAAVAPPGAAEALRAGAAKAGLGDRFLALLRVYETTQDEELRNDVLNDLEGRPVAVGRVRRALREIREADRYKFAAGSSHAHAHERLVLAALFCRAHGLRGLVVLFDELERLTAFGPRSRVAAYRELGWWRKVCNDPAMPLFAVFASADNAHHRFTDKGDTARVKALKPEDPETESVVLGHALFGTVQDLDPIVDDAAQLHALRKTVAEIYGEAYGFAPSDGDLTDSYPTIRAALRSWIARWDMERLAPGETGAIVTETLEFGATTFSDEELAAIASDDDA